MSKWPDGFDVSVGCYPDSGWFAYVYDRRPGVAWAHLPGYTTEQQAEGAVIDWIQRRIGVPETVPQPVLTKELPHGSVQRVDGILRKVEDLQAHFGKVIRCFYATDSDHTAAAECERYREGLLEALKASLQREKEMIREKLWENR
jgi:hypothetical protein